MCGIVGYIGAPAPSDRPLNVVLDGLTRLEYRGYDSAGVAVTGEAGIDFRKKAGRVDDLRALIADAPLADGVAAIGHTRWATHGGPSDANSHPHVSPDGKVAVVHNGIIENAPQIRAELEADGAVFTSETDTETIAHLVAKELPTAPSLTEAVRAVVNRLHGSFAIVVTAEGYTDRIVGARRN